MTTDVFKQLQKSVLVGIIFGVALNAGRLYKNGLTMGNLNYFLYIFILMGGTFFMTGLMLNRRRTDTTNMRIFAIKMSQKGILRYDGQAQMKDGKIKKGWLYLTDKMLIFANTPDPELIEKKAIRLSITKAESIERFKPTPFTNDGIRVTMKKGNSYEFYVSKTGKWMDMINEIKFGDHKKDKDVEVEVQGADE
ncbi:MAG: hypothetical protein JNG49_00840 [Peptostreptococcus stomatis]|uniref:hypothetical protein n=1 Tax=Peptostreptococcus stomatis TaxID=341694 RepID=UPI0003066A6D|nr:hypothetical protein [Peptostreptococcus stomatis]MBL6464939.1 hypothetical protein [Peptostreptococcus stomatis]